MRSYAEVRGPTANGPGFAPRPFAPPPRRPCRGRYFLTAFTAASAYTYPAPTSHSANPGRGRAVCVRTDAIRSGVRLPPAASCISATTPVTCGVAIDVPDAQV